MFDANDNWDDDFEFQKATMSWKSHENWDDDFEDDQRDDDDDNGDNGDNDNDEDQTVTARSRRIAFSKLTSPPPLPTLPFPFFPSPPHTLPRSPTSSVFSIPNYRPPSSATSQTLLRPTTSRSSSGHGGLSGIPPSPPRHRERERRRLRKKSRPPVGTTYEMTEVPTSSRDDDEVLEPSTTGTLLSRIGSVKKWGVRRKKGSTPAPSADADVDREGDFHHYDPEEQPQSGLTPRPHARRPTSDVPLPASTLLEQKERSRRRSLAPSPSPSFSHSHSHSPSPSPSPSPVPSHFHSQAPGFNTSGTNGTNTTGPVRNASGTTTVTTTSSGSARNTSGNSTSSWFMRSVSASHSITTTTTTSTSPSTSASPSASKSPDSSASSRIKSGSSTNLDNDISPSHDLRKTPTRTRPMAVFPSSTSFSRSPSPSPSPVRLTPPGAAAAAAANNKTTTNGNRNLPYSPAKLLKRKSLGFVQLKFGLGGGDRDREREEREKEREKEENHASVQHSSTSRNMVYMGLGVGRVGAGGGVGGEDRESESRTESQPQRDREEVNAPEEKGESLNGRRGFMDGVRRISLTVGAGEDAGRHTRTKSGSAGPGVPVSASISASVLGHAPVPYGGEDTHANANVHGLLPPIELQPPSPPQTIGKQSGSGVMGTETETETESSMGGVQSRRALEKTPGSPGSPGQASSLGRSSGVGAGASVPLPLPVPVSVPVPAPVMRRSSLGDLKIPERISQAQVSLRRDLGMVREFAANVEQLKELQVTYRGLVGEVQSVLDTHALHHQQQQQQQPPSRAASPSFLTSLSKPKSRNRSNTNPPLPSSSLHSLPPSQLQPFHQHPQQQQQNTPQIAYKHLASAFYTINSKYRISWECAELLIELGGGASSSSSSSANNDNGTSPPSTSVSAPVLGASGPGVDMNLGLHLNLIGKKGSGGRERAITLAGDESKPASPVPDGESSVRSASPQTQTMSPPLASPPSLAWRASTGRHDLSHRQLVLLREMLHKADSSLNLREVSTSTPIVEESNNTRALNVNREWRWGDAMSSTITLPSEESGGGESRKKRRQSRLGMSGLRDMLRALKRGYGVPNPPPPAVGGVQASSTSISTEESSLDLRLPPHPQQQQHGRRRAKTSLGPESMRGPSSLTSKPSPRRPSLASIFRIGRGNKASGHESQGVVEHTHGHPPRSTSGRSKSASASASSSAGDGDGDGEEEDWDRIDSVSDLDAALGIRHGHHDDGDDDDDTEARFGSATVRGKGSPYLQDALLHRHIPAAPPPPPVPHLPARPVTPKRSASASQSSIWGAGAESSSGGGQSSIPGTRSTRLSNVEENTDNIQQHTRSSAKTKQHGASSPSRTFLRDPNIQKNGSVRSMPPHSVSGGGLAMTPENIKPLLENGKEVHVRLVECIEEIRSLLSVHADLRMRV